MVVDERGTESVDGANAREWMEPGVVPSHTFNNEHGHTLDLVHPHADSDREGNEGLETLAHSIWADSDREEESRKDKTNKELRARRARVTDRRAEMTTQKLVRQNVSFNLLVIIWCIANIVPSWLSTRYLHKFNVSRMT
jgi:hypothetical protein